MPSLLIISLAAFAIETVAAAKFGFGLLDGAAIALIPTAALFCFGFWGIRWRIAWPLIGVPVQILIFGLIALACILANPDFQSVTGPNVQIVIETARVRQLILDQVLRDAESAERLSRSPIDASSELISEMRRDAAKYYPGKNFWKRCGGNQVWPLAAEDSAGSLEPQKSAAVRSGN